MKLTKEDKKYLKKILEEHHKKINVISIKKCPKDNCWYKQIIKKIK